MATVTRDERRTALLVPVAADALVAGFRHRHNAFAVARGLPPHITVLYPFAPALTVTETTSSDLARHFGTFPQFEAELTGVDSFSGFVWLAPEPRTRFLELIESTCARYPAFPPYAGGGGEPEPHLTIAATGAGGDLDGIVQLARSELSPMLPFRFSVSSVSLFEEGSDGRWSERQRFALA